LLCEKEGNPHDPYAMAIIDVDNRVVGHVSSTNISRLLLVLFQ
jgi:hypothetical protein